MLDNLPRVFTEGLQQLDPSISDFQLEQLLRYRKELLDWNTRVNLTAITDPEEVLLKHFLDSLSLLSAYDQPHTKLLDIGSGAGFPGLALKIVRPQWNVTLLEATGKKVAFLQHIIDTLQLTNVVAIHGRAEELAHNKQYRGQFDLVTARAVSSLSTLLEYSASYSRVGGYMIFPKKGELAQELIEGRRAAAIVGAAFVSDVPVMLPGIDDGRRLLVWRQVKKCPEVYPRSGGVMGKRPLL